MDALTKSLDHSRAVMSSARETALQLKASGMMETMTPMQSSFLGDWSNQTKNRQGYAAFRGWLYSAIHALASEAAGQAVNLGRLGDPKKESPKPPKGTKSYLTNKMTSTMRSKSARDEIELVLDHPMLDALEHPNDIQLRWQFVYSFVANLNLTGWAYIVANKTKEGVEFYSLPTIWIRPDHKEGPFSKFFVVNPNRPGSYAEAEPLSREQVAFAHIPNPSDPLSALAPIATQMAAIRIDDHIQTSQERFFENGIFPSVVVTMGKGPFMDTQGRPVLTGVQRRQITGAIRRVMSGVANYGNPAIVDGLIEKIDRLSATQNEMGWDKSEDKVRTRILSAFGVHPYILGEAVSVGGYAQVAKIEERFCKRVNAFLDFLGSIMSGFAATLYPDDRLSVWWEATKPNDPGLAWQKFSAARTNGDISQNEMRAEIGLPPDEDTNESVISTATAGAIVQLLAQVGAGAVTNVQAEEMMIGMGLPDDMAKKIAGEAKPPPPEPAPIAPRAAPGAVPKPESEAIEEATEELKKAIDLLKAPPETLTELIMPCVKCANE